MNVFPAIEKTYLFCKFGVICYAIVLVHKEGALPWTPVLIIGGNIMSPFFSFLLALLVAAVVLLIVDKFVSGFTVGGFANAMVAALAIAVVSAFVSWFLFGGVLDLTATGWWGAIINLVVAALVLVLAGKITPGMAVSGFGGAAIAAVAIGVVYWLLEWLVGLF
jgi:putative membrane protein